MGINETPKFNKPAGNAPATPRVFFPEDSIRGGLTRVTAIVDNIGSTSARAFIGTPSELPKLRMKAAESAAKTLERQKVIFQAK